MKSKPVTPVTMKHVRKMLGLSLRGMADLIGVEWKSVWRWEKGTRPAASIWVEAYALLRSAIKLGIAPESIIDLSKSSVGRLRFYAKLRDLILETRP